MHTHVHCENDWFVQIDIDGDPPRVPEAWCLAAAPRAVDACERPANLTNRTRRGLDGSLARLDQTRALVRLQPGSPMVNSLHPPGCVPTMLV
jgi:hypothetical protein